MARLGFWITPLLLIIITTRTVNAENWPVWRGPRGDGTVHDTGFPLKWSSKENVTWKTEIPGRGHSSPIVWEDRIFVTSCLEGTDPKDKTTPRDRVLICVDRKDGKIVWQKTVVTSKLEPVHKENSYSSSTPATDGKLIYVTFFDKPKVIVAAYDFDGKEVWRKSPGEFESVHGYGIPPILYKDLVIINCDQDGEKRTNPAYIVALDKKTGDEKWRIDRPNRIRSYCPPLIVGAGGKMQMVLTGCKTVASYDPDNGNQHWITTLMKLLKAYTDRMPESIGAMEYKAAKDAGVDKIHFAYTGDPEPGKGYTYRVQGPTFLVEFLNMQTDGSGNPANHIHSVWRHLPSDFGL